MTQSATATAPTEHASRYLQQLCKHWSHKAETDFTPESGTITFASGNLLKLGASAVQLTLDVTVPDAEDLEHFKGVVDAHLLRFAFREDLEIVWG
ncbi:hypothetical protein SAMN05444000_1039 [Shimia gijangensis]|uniref:DUF2218 domain-containing protein n=1 Tax=Shimia gijangensis TaxID=1470563 RepID=A0A1M6DUH8_9RHOB|nr:DUF2218 domain-containing protein [Shimia gijangensis]SHI76789.1 hypothetical protein SAMN05444000_1039 [Shimia gijangensis]